MISKERLEEIKEFGLARIINPLSDYEILSLVDIALAAEAQEPVAWLVHTKQPDPFTTRQRRIAEKAAARGLALTPLYAAPPVAQPVQVPDGWKLVPVVPTREMREAFHVAHEEAESGDCDVWVPDHHWQAMLAAAPRPGNE